MTAIAMFATAALVATGMPAQAATYTRGDARGDGEYLDITSVHIDNRARSVITTVSFDRVRRGDLIVAIDVQHQHRGGYRIVSEYLGPDQEPRNHVLLQNWPARHGHRRCPALSVVWDTAAETATVRAWDNCLGGDHGDVSLSILTERGGDDDWAPEDANGEIAFTRWIAAG